MDIYEPDSWLFYINITSIEILALKLIYLFFLFFPPCLFSFILHMDFPCAPSLAGD